ncbi:MAG: uroporphyrinogen decarboxylase family protein [Oliverpabstia sp.]
MAMKKFEPDYRNIVDAAFNRTARRLPLYEHNVDAGKIAEMIGKDFTGLYEGDDRDVEEFFSRYCGFFRDYGYDVVTFEGCIGQILPGGGALGDCRIVPAIQTREDFECYPWEEIPELYFKRYGKYFSALRNQMPEGMKAIGGVGNGIFECVQDLTGYQNLCLMMYDDEELFAQLFQKIGETNLKIWQRFMKEYGDIYCVLRFGDDLGYRSNTLLSTETLKEFVIPRYRPIIDLVHQYKKPFLLHSCGKIFSVMEDLIQAGIDAKHSNEDQIAPFSQWVESYGDRIGNFGGLDVDAVCRMDRAELKEYIVDTIHQVEGHGGIAIGTGNSIPAYVPAEGYRNMIEIVREYRGDL